MGSQLDEMCGLIEKSLAQALEQVAQLGCQDAAAGAG